MATSWRRSRSEAISAGSSAGSRRTPTRAPASTGCSRRSFHSASVSRAESSQSSGSTRPLRMISGNGRLLAVDALLEGPDAEAAHGVDEALLGGALLDVGGDQLLDHVGHLGRGERGPDHLAERGVAVDALRPADGHLVPLGAVLVDAEDADVADVVMAAGVHAARDVQVELADVMQIIEVVEAPLDRLGDRDRLGVGERAEVAAGAADDVREQAHVGGGEAGGARLPPELEEVALAHVGE